MRLRFVPVPGDHMPAGMCVVVAQGEGEMVVQIASDYALEDVCTALSATLTGWLGNRFVYVGQVSEDADVISP